MLDLRADFAKRVLRGMQKTNDNATCAYIFQSIHRVMEAEECLKDKGLACDLVPVPREISSECGMALVVASHSLELADDYLIECKITPVARYRREGNSW